jgi:hypothetical protein
MRWSNSQVCSDHVYEALRFCPEIPDVFAQKSPNAAAQERPLPHNIPQTVPPKIRLSTGDAMKDLPTLPKAVGSVQFKSIWPKGTFSMTGRLNVPTRKSVVVNPIYINL